MTFQEQNELLKIVQSYDPEIDRIDRKGFAHYKTPVTQITRKQDYTLYMN
jgi:hypothetical protein